MSKGNGTIGIILNKMEGVTIESVNGKECVVIPVEENAIYISAKGTAVLSFYMSKMPEMKWGKTHCLKRRLTKDEYKNATKTFRENMPICGYFEPYRSKAEFENNKTSYTPKEKTAEQKQTCYQSIDDLPF